MNNLKTQFLAFINTNSLFQEIDGLQQFEFDQNEIDNLDFSQLEITKRLTLGNRVERFFEFYINESKNYELVKNNIQVIKDKHTIGELDFIIYDRKEKRYIHIEHVYKFYLYDETVENEIDRYIGPNCNDTLVKKLTKLKEKQFPLLYKDETKKYLSDLDIEINQNNIEQKVCFKGNLYLPLHLKNTKLPILNDLCVRGFYINKEKFLRDEEFKKYEYFKPIKFDWICDASINDTWFSYDEVYDSIKILLDDEKSTLVWMRDTEKNITKSFFVTYW